MMLSSCLAARRSARLEPRHIGVLQRYLSIAVSPNHLLHPCTQDVHILSSRAYSSSVIARLQPVERNGRVRAHQSVSFGDQVYLSGQVDFEGQSVATQTANILDKIDELLQCSGSDKHHILSAQIWLSDIATFNEMNQVWDNWVSQEHAPVRACVESKLAVPELLVEISVVAVKRQ